MITVSGCKCVLEEALANCTYFYHTFLDHEIGRPVTVYLWRNGANIPVRGWYDGPADYRDERDALALCEQFGMPDAIVSNF